MPQTDTPAGFPPAQELAANGPGPGILPGGHLQRPNASEAASRRLDIARAHSGRTGRRMRLLAPRQDLESARHRPPSTFTAPLPEDEEQSHGSICLLEQKKVRMGRRDAWRAGRVNALFGA